jgi:MtN3 and saliva related transmembrane protein
VTTVLGAFAAALTIASFIAQTRKIAKTHDTRALSGSMWIMTTSAFAVWVGYGVLLDEWPLIITNAVCCALAGTILVLKFRDRKQSAAGSRAIVPARSSR